MAGNHARIRQAISETDMEAIRNIRHQVFVEEQGIPVAHEQDGLDHDALHVVAVAGDAVIGTGRLVLKSEQTGVVGRIALLPAHRGAGLATQIVQGLEELARARGITKLELLPHAELEKFYAGLGYQTVPGGEFMIGQHRVLTMLKSLEPAE